MNFRPALARSLQYCLLIGATAAAAQEPLTLHVYTNTIQVPVLVLDHQRRMMPPIAAARFAVSIDSGRQYKASHVRLEGDDPISLAIVLDVKPEAPLMSEIGDALAALVPRSLTSRDHVSIYAMDCNLLRTLAEAPADTVALKAAVATALQGWKASKEQAASPPCLQSVQLRDSLAYVADELSHSNGRRVILAVSSGEDAASLRGWKETRNFIQNGGATLFGLSLQTPAVNAAWLTSKRGEDPFDVLCQLTGGMLLHTAPNDLKLSLTIFTDLVRGRYIVEFPRPAAIDPGPHSIQVTISKLDGFIRPSGFAVPLPDPKLLVDPTTIPSDPSKTPEVGKRKTLPQPR